MRVYYPRVSLTKAGNFKARLNVKKFAVCPEFSTFGEMPRELRKKIAEDAGIARRVKKMSFLT